jgi:restriction endonuclease S subunit
MSPRPASRVVIPGIGNISVGDPQNGEPEGWQWVLLTDVARLESGHTPSRKHPDYWGGDIPWVSLPDARRHHGCVIGDTTQKTTESGIANSAARVLPANTVCLSRTASVGHVFRLGRPMATSQDFVNWVCSEALEPQFLMYALMAEGSHIRNFGKGTTHTTIYFPEVLAFHLCLPPIAEQHRIVAKLEALLAGVSIARDRLGKVPNILQRFRHAVLVGGCSGTLTADWREAQSTLMDPSELRRRLLAARKRAWERSEIGRF